MVEPLPCSILFLAVVYFPLYALELRVVRSHKESRGFLCQRCYALLRDSQGVSWSIYLNPRSIPNSAALFFMIPTK